MPKRSGYRKAVAVLATVFAVLCLLSACDARSTRVVLSGPTMGTSWSVVYADPGSVDAKELQALLEGELEAINLALSTYLPASEISRINDHPGPLEVVLSERFGTVLDTALTVGSLTGGAYDVTVGPLVELWGFGAREFTGTVPDDQAIDAAQALVGAQKLAWDPVTRTLTRPGGMRIDLSSVAKGYAVDQLAQLLEAQGVRNALVEIGGELRALGERPEGGLWRVAVESPDPSQGRLIEALAVSNASVATSGDYRNYFEVHGVRYSHLVDPRSGYPVAHELVSVTVVDVNCMRADALATALIVLGLEEARALAERENLAAYFVSRGPDGLAVHYTPAFDVYRQRDQRSD